MLEFQQNVYGFRQTKKLMKELEPELFKQMDKAIKGKLAPIIQRAKNLTPVQRPLRNWKTPHNPYSRPSYSPYGKRWEYDRLEWDTFQAKKQIVVRAGGGRRRRGSVTRPIYQLQSNNAANAVFELMGRGKSREWMIGNVGRKFPGTGRVLYRAFDQENGQNIERDVLDTLLKYQEQFNRRLDAAGGP